jgi:hypothetical protein
MILPSDVRSIKPALGLCSSNFPITLLLLLQRQPNHLGVKEPLLLFDLCMGGRGGGGGGSNGPALCYAFFSSLI